MNILHLLSQHQLTGAEVYATQLIDQQIQKKHSVFQISNHFFADSKAQKTKMNVETTSIFEFLCSIYKLRQFLITNKIQVIHSHSRAASRLAFFARSGLKIGAVSSIHGRQHPSISKKINNDYGEFLIAVCANIENQLTQEFKYNPRRIKVIGNGISENLFKLSPEKNPTDTLNIAIIGRDTGPKKIRTEIFISEFAKLLRAKNIKYQFTIVGSDPQKIDVQSEAVTFLEFVKTDSKFYQQFDLICGSGRVCIESMLSGVPVVAFGESSYLGLITTENYASAKESNFGDIGKNFDLPVFNPNQAASDFQNYSKVDLRQLADLAFLDFNLTYVAAKIERLYEGAYFIRNYPWWIPILMYHKIPNTPIDSPHKIFVTKDNFKRSIGWLKFLGFQTLTFSELSAFRKGQKDFSHFPTKPLILTFDDGYQDNITNADPILKTCHFKAQIFLLADPNINSNIWDQNSESTTSKDLLVSGKDRQQWNKTNFEIGSHGLNHKRMPPMTSSEKMFELTESKQQLESEFLKPINVFAYTFGDTNSECASACEAAGYEYGLNTDTGGLLIEENPYSIFRVNIFPDESLFTLWKKTSCWYRKYYFSKRQR